MKNWSGKVVLVLAIVALLFTILGNPVVQERVSTFTPTSLVGREIKDILTVGLSNVAYAAAPDYPVSGTADDEVQAALDALPETGGKIVIFGGDYTFAATVSRAINNVTFEGSGRSTYLAYNASTALISVGSQTGWIFKDIRTDAGWLITNTDTIVVNCWNNTTLVNRFSSTAIVETQNNKGAASGYAGLGANTLVPTAQLGTETASSTTYLRGDQTWATPAGGSATPTASSFVSYATDFANVTAATNPPWVGAAISAGTLVVTIAGTANHPGIAEFRSSTTANSGYQFTTSAAASAFLIAGTETTEFVFRVVTTGNTAIRLGFQDSITSTAPTDGVWIDIAATTLTGKAKNNAGPTTTASSYTITASTWYRAKIVVNSDATRVDFYLYDGAGTQLWTNNVQANIPTAAGRETYHGAVATNSGTTAYALIDLDYMSLYMTRTLTR